MTCCNWPSPGDVTSRRFDSPRADSALGVSRARHQTVNMPRESRTQHDSRHRQGLFLLVWQTYYTNYVFKHRITKQLLTGHSGSSSFVGPSNQTVALREARVPSKQLFCYTMFKKIICIICLPHQQKQPPSVSRVVLCT
jgi:hypothetical protein